MIIKDRLHHKFLLILNGRDFPDVWIPTLITQHHFFSVGFSLSASTSIFYLRWQIHWFCALICWKLWASQWMSVCIPLFAWLLQYIAALLVYWRPFINVCPIVKSGDACAIQSTLNLWSVYSATCHLCNVISSWVYPHSTNLDKQILKNPDHEDLSGRGGAVHTDWVLNL